MSKKQCLTRFLKFYVFKQSFCCVEDLEQELERIVADLSTLTEIAKENSWFEFWQSQGNEIVLNLWNSKYKDYLDTKSDAKSVNSEETIEEQIVNDVKTFEDNEVFDADTDETNTITWQFLWDEHSAEIYAVEYQEFETIYQNYFWLLKVALCEGLQKTKQTENIYKEIETDLEQLRLAGLPTAFGSKSQQNRKKQQESKQKTELYEIELITELDFDEDNNNTSESSESEMPPIKQNDNSSSSTTDEQISFELKDDNLHDTQNKVISKSKSKLKSKQNRLLRIVPDFMKEEKSMLKYWRQRFSLFSRFDEGIQLDRESWFSVTPEKVAQHMAKRLACNVIVDGFCGSGGNAIQFAQTCNKVIAIDIDSKKIEMAKHNAGIYGVADKIEFIVGDFLELSESGKIKADIVFLSPPWGGPNYNSIEKYNIETCLEPVGGSELIRKSRCISNNIAFFLPRNADMKQIISLAGIGKVCEVEHNYLGSRVVGLTAFYGSCIKQD